LIQALALVLALWSGAAAAQPARTENVEAQFHSSRAAVAPGERFTIVLRQSIREGWHTYWVNPGDSGEPTQLTWRAPNGWNVGPIQWPAPEAIPFDILVNFGYSGEVLFPIAVTAPANARVGDTVTLEADAYWLVCSDICIPEEAKLSLSVPIAAQGRVDSVWSPRIAAAVEALPRIDPAVSARITSGSPATLSLTLSGAQNIRNPHFFPFDRDAVRASAPQRPRVGPTGLSFSLIAGAADNLGAGPLSGIVTYETPEAGGWTRRAVAIEAAPGAPILDTSAQSAAISPDFALADLEGAPALEEPNLDAVALIAALGFAFLGGLILNIMPCVLPVLSVKALSFAGGAHAGAARRHGVLYLVGVLATFLALAGALIAFRSAGEALGWGFQLQAPWVTSGLALLFFVIGLNLLGVFHAMGFEDAGSGLAARGGDLGAFFTGALAVVAATPCTAPFMAGAVGALITQSAATTLLVFSALAFGFAAPMTALSFAPALQRLIPKPGPWMERVKSVLAFPMFATAVWLAWVVAEQTGPRGVLALLSIATALSFALFVGRWGRVWAVAGALAVLAVIAFSWRPLAGIESTRVIASEPWSAVRVEQLRAEGRGVFVNFTAAWCVTCKVNEATSLLRPRVAEAFARENVAYLVADWTNRDDEIAAALESHGRAGVPLYLFYPAEGGEPIVLPQLLTEPVLIEAIERPG
jgi:thiol:disulfide interchange protein DsbD